MSRFAIVAASDTCSGQILASGATCSFTVRFTPVNIGARTAFVTASAARAARAALSLTGTGT